MVTNKDHVQYHTCIMGVAVVLVRIPVAGSHMEFDGTSTGHVIPGEAQDGIEYIGSNGAAGMPGEEELAGIAIAQW